MTRLVPSDPELVAGIAAGDPAAFAAFYDRHSSFVYGLLIRMLGRTAEADDALQETFLQVWREASRYEKDRASPTGWLVMMARSRAVDWLRRQGTAAGRPGWPPPASSPDVGDGCERDEAACRVRAAVNRLPDVQRSAIELAFFGGLTYEQVATQQAIPVGTAKTRIRLGIQRLRQLLGGPTEE